MLLSLHQQQFCLPSIDSDKVDELLSNAETEINGSLKAYSRDKGNFYMLPEVSLKSDFALFKVAVKVSDLSIKSSIAFKEITGSLNKADWERFWQLYNLVQEECEVIYIDRIRVIELKALE